MPKAGRGKSKAASQSLDMPEVPELAPPGDPWVNDRGEVIQAQKRSEFLPTIIQNTKTNPQTFRGKKPRNISDLPAPPGLMNGIGAILMYSFFGVGDREIADALKCSVAELEVIRGHAAYAEYFELLTEQIIAADSESLQNRIAAYSHAALDKVAHVSNYGLKEENVLRASIDLLDRGGHSAKNVNENRQQLKNTLRIQLVKADGNETSINVQLDQELGE